VSNDGLTLEEYIHAQLDAECNRRVREWEQWWARTYIHGEGTGTPTGIIGTTAP
jgi:hypothetical protein